MSGKLNIPLSWEEVSLRDLGEWRGGGTPSKANLEFWTGGTIPWVSPKDMKASTISSAEDRITPSAVEGSAVRMIDAGAVLVVTRSGILRRTLPVAVTRVNVTVNQDLKALVPREGIHPAFVAYGLRRFEQEILGTCSKAGTTVDSIEFPQFLRFSIPVAPVPEQVRVVQAIEEQFSRLDAAVLALQRVQTNLKRYRAAVLKAACEGRLVPTEAELARQEGRDYEPADVLLERVLAERRARREAEELVKLARAGKKPKGEAWKQKYKEPVAPDVACLPELPEGWIWSSIQQIADTSSGGTPSRAEGSFFGGAIPWVKSGELGDGVVRSTEEAITEAGLRNSSAKLFPRGTLCIALYGATVGKLGVLDFDAATNQAVCGIFLPPQIETWFVFYWLRSQRAALVERGKGGAQPNISQEIVRETLLPLPPLAEQRRIVAEIERRLSAVEVMEATVTLDLRRADRLRQSILKRAYEGKLVPQDPSDEPASALLERIRAEHAEAERPRRRRGLARQSS